MSKRISNTNILIKIRKKKESLYIENKEVEAIDLEDSNFDLNFLQDLIQKLPDRYRPALNVFPSIK